MRTAAVVVYMVLGLVVIIAGVGAGGMNEEDIRAEIRQSQEHYGEYLIAGDFEAWSELHTTDVVKMKPGAPAIMGREALLKDIAAVGQAMEWLAIEIRNQDLQVKGDVVYTWCNYSMRMRPRSGGDIINFEGKALTLYRRENGRWLLSHDCFNANAVAPSS